MKKKTPMLICFGQIYAFTHMCLIRVITVTNAIFIVYTVYCINCYFNLLRSVCLKNKKNNLKLKLDYKYPKTLNFSPL